jgi:UDP-3-O-[3-hydroxymyristoyl] glucosamine N-acyltransferase
MANVPAGAEMGGTPAQPLRSWLWQVAWLRRVTRARGWGKTAGERAAEGE